METRFSLLLLARRNNGLYFDCIIKNEFFWTKKKWSYKKGLNRTELSVSPQYLHTILSLFTESNFPIYCNCKLEELINQRHETPDEFKLSMNYYSKNQNFLWCAWMLTPNFSIKTSLPLLKTKIIITSAMREKFWSFDISYRRLEGFN